MRQRHVEDINFDVLTEVKIDCVSQCCTWMYRFVLVLLAPYRLLTLCLQVVRKDRSSGCSRRMFMKWLFELSLVNRSIAVQPLLKDYGPQKLSSFKDFAKPDIISSCYFYAISFQSFFFCVLETREDFKRKRICRKILI